MQVMNNLETTLKAPTGSHSPTLIEAAAAGTSGWMSHKGAIWETVASSGRDFGYREQKPAGRLEGIR
jgi:hypothetical protein